MQKFEFNVEIQATSREKAQEKLDLMLKMIDINTMIDSIVNIFQETIEPKKPKESESNPTEKE